MGVFGFLRYNYWRRLRKSTYNIPFLNSNWWSAWTSCVQTQKKYLQCRAWQDCRPTRKFNLCCQCCRCLPLWCMHSKIVLIKCRLTICKRLQKKTGANRMQLLKRLDPLNINPDIDMMPILTIEGRYAWPWGACVYISSIEGKFSEMGDWDFHTTYMICVAWTERLVCGIHSNIACLGDINDGATLVGSTLTRPLLRNRLSRCKKHRFFGAKAYLHVSRYIWRRHWWCYQSKLF